jgi:hypothetical protein
LAGRAGPGPAPLRRPLIPASRPARVAVGAFLAVLLTCGLFGLEFWPFSGFKLFSQLRTDRQVRWELTADGRPVDFSTLPRGYRQGAHVLPTLARGSASRREAACRAWSSVSTGALQVYRVVATSAGPGKPFVERERVLVFDCPEPAR